METATFEDRPCPRTACKGKCVYQLRGAPSISTVNMSNQPFDVTVGADAAKRWERYHERQKKRDKIRQESGAKALSATTHDDWRGVPKARLREVVIPPSAQEKLL
jgi:hypothetical protein